MRTIEKIGLLLVLCFIILFVSCNSDNNKGTDKKTTEEYSDEVTMLRSFLSTYIPMDIKKIIYDSDMNAFLIDGDIKMSLEDAKKRFDETEKQAANKTDQRRTANLMTPEFSSSVKVYIAPEVSSEWKIAIKEAINNWNTINSSIYVTIVDEKVFPSINITTFNGGNAKAIAYATLPSGVPGNSIEINTYYNNLSASKKVRAMTHELGHNFGLQHTDGSDGSIIPCTPASEMSSVMFSLIDNWAGFTAYDNIAISSLYPVGPDTKKLYRFKKNDYYFYTTDPCEIIPGKDGYIFDGDVGYLYATQFPETEPLYRSVNGTIDKGHVLGKTKSSDSVLLGYLYPNYSAQPETTVLYCVKGIGNANTIYTTEDMKAVLQLNYGRVLHKFLRNKEVSPKI